MKAYLLFVTSLILLGCGRQEENQREVMGKLETLQSELASRREVPVRWAFANKREIESAIFQYSRDKMEAAKTAEALAPEVEGAIRQYEALQSELMRKQMETMRLRSLRPGVPDATAADPDYVALSNRVATAKVPIADILDRRSRQASQYRDQFSVEKLIGEYVKDRFDLVVDSSDAHFSRSPVLYRKAGEALDITDGVLKLLQEKTKP